MDIPQPELTADEQQSVLRYCSMMLGLGPDPRALTRDQRTKLYEFANRVYGGWQTAYRMTRPEVLFRNRFQAMLFGVHDDFVRSYRRRSLLCDAWWQCLHLCYVWCLRLDAQVKKLIRVRR